MSVHAGHLDGAPALGVPRPGAAARVRLGIQPAFPLVAAAFCALSFQAVTVTGGIADGEGGPALKLYHALFAALGLLVLGRARLVRWRAEMVLYFGVVALTTLVAYMGFGPRPIVVNTLFAAYAATVGATLGAMAGGDVALRALRLTSLVVLGAVLAKGALHLPEIIAFLAAPNGHPTLPTFYGGGPNLEATWVAMAGVFFVGSRLFLPYALGSAAISVAYASRVGLIVVAMVLVAAAVRALVAAGGVRRLGRGWLAGAALGAVCVGAFGAARGIEGADYVAQRFQSIGDDPGSVGRLVLWEGGMRVFAAHPFGVGQGNAVPMIERVLGASLPEDNLHNQYLQHLVETGVQGLLVYLVLAVMAWRRTLAARCGDPLLVYVAIYFVIALVQFRGAEALLWFVYGVQSGTLATPQVSRVA